MSPIDSRRGVVLIQVGDIFLRSLLYLLTTIDFFLLGDHVDILGRASLNDLILRIAGGHGEAIEENYVSRIKEYADRVKIYDDDDDRN
jgi:hypothetical protein